MRDIRASVEVRALIGAEGLHQLHGDAFARYHCWRCGRTGRTTEPTSVIVVERVVKLAHAACADSQIIEAPPGWGQWPANWYTATPPSARSRGSPAASVR